MHGDLFFYCWLCTYARSRYSIDVGIGKKRSVAFTSVSLYCKLVDTIKMQQEKMRTNVFNCTVLSLGKIGTYKV